MFSHTITQVSKIPRDTDDDPLRQKYQNIWFEKQDTENSVLKEVVAQKIFRLFIPHQPKTQLATDTNDQTYVLSKGIPEYKSLSEFIRNRNCNSSCCTQRSGA